MGNFDDLLSANRDFADTFDMGDLEGVARAGVAIVTCMDSRIDPLALVGLRPGDAKVIRNPGGQVTPQALEALVLSVNLLNVSRVLVIPHTKCAMASGTEDQIRARVEASAGKSASWQPFGVIGDPVSSLEKDVQKVTSHPLVPESVKVGGFLYDVESGRLEQKF